MGRIGQEAGRENLEPAREFIDFAEFSLPKTDLKPLGREM
jgi:hypothetical protein